MAECILIQPQIKVHGADGSPVSPVRTVPLNWSCCVHPRVTGLEGVEPFVPRKALLGLYLQGNILEWDELPLFLWEQNTAERNPPNFGALLEIWDHLEGEACREVSVCSSQMPALLPQQIPRDPEGSASLISTVAVAAVPWFQLEGVKLGLEGALSIWHISTWPCSSQNPGMGWVGRVKSHPNPPLP